MISSLRPPTRIPATPWSHPLITWPPPSWNGNGRPRSQDASNSLPVDHDTPTYWTTAVLPTTASAPVPTRRSFTTRVVGGGPWGMVTTGLVESGELPAAGGVAAAFEPPDAAGVVDPQPTAASPARISIAPTVRLRTSAG